MSGPLRSFGCALLCAVALGCAGWPDRSPVVAEGSGFAITLAELDHETREMLVARRTRGQASRLYELRSEVLDAWIEERVLGDAAQRRGLDVDAMLDADAGPVTPEEVQAFFDAHAERLPPGTELEDVEEQIREHLFLEKRDAAAQAILAAADVRIHLEPPRFDVAAVGPALGPADAPITVIEFSDFQCPFCRRALPTLRELRKRHPQDVRVVYRHLPLETIHPRARAAAEASVCAEQQGRFWEFHDRLFEAQDALSDADLRAHAEALGLDLTAWDACLADPAPAARVDADVEAARAVGLSGTPAFLVNGVLLTGAKPIDDFERLIERERTAGAGAP
ncbi:MAG: DsbA family protein [Myxococcota bacterium]